MKRLISVFDYSGVWSDPFRRNGWDVHQWDLKIDELMDINNIDCVETALDLFEYCDGLLFAPPCTEFTVSCSQYWDMKDADGRTAAAMQLINQCQKIAYLFMPTDFEYDGSFFWVLENPVGRLQKLAPELGDPWYFDPYEFAGWLDPGVHELAALDEIRMKKGHGLAKYEVDLVVSMNAYKKKTGLWGCFNRDIVKKPIRPVKCSPQGSFTQRYGGKSDKTKEERSVTPAGFAEAFFHANHDFMGWKEAPYRYE